MGNLTIALFNTAGAQRAFRRAIETVQNNVINVHTPGYARQRPTFDNAPFNPELGQAGGILPGVTQSSRAKYAEESVRNSTGDAGRERQLSSGLAPVEKAFDLNGPSSVPQALSRFFNSFSQLSVNPNDRLLRQQVIDQAGTLAQTVNSSAQEVSKAVGRADSELVDAIQAVNSRVAKLKELNTFRRSNPVAAKDGGLEGESYALLEEISEYVEVSPVANSDGTVSLYLAGMTPLLVGENQYELTTDITNTSSKVLDAQGRDMTAELTRGRVAGLLEQKNSILPSFQAELNTFAQNLADVVNNKLATGVDRNGSAPVTPLFTYDAMVGAAYSLGVSGIQPDEIAAASATAPGGNGNALDIAALANTQTINGLSLSEYYGRIGARFGRELSDARQNQELQENLVAQAQAYRNEQSGVDLDQEAAELIQLQRAFEASAEMFRVLNSLTESVMGMLR